jgi:kynurenine formamidase
MKGYGSEPAVIDLSHGIHDGMPVYPGTLGPSVMRTAEVSRDGFTERVLTLSTHTGTHLDAPSHMIAGAPSLEDFTPDRFCGPALVLRPGEGGGVIGLGTLLAFEAAIRESEFVLLDFGWGRLWGTPGYLSGHPVLSTDAARWLADFDLKGIGFDTVSADRVDTEDYPVHHAILSRNRLIIENLANLDSVPGQRIFLCCFPLPVREAEASPVRAVGFTHGPGNRDRW